MFRNCKICDGMHQRRHPLGEESAGYHIHGAPDGSLLVDDEDADVLFLSSYLGGATLR